MKKHLRIIIAISGAVLLLAAIFTGLQLNAGTTVAHAQWSVGNPPDVHGNSTMQEGNNRLADNRTKNIETSAQNDEQNQGNGLDASGVEGGGGPDGPLGMISYQGRLLKNGGAYTGNINITFRLYIVSTGSTAWYTETQTVSVQNGLFNVMLGTVTPLRYQTEKFGRQQWLGIQPSGAATELTPRQLLSTVGYAFGLVPGTSVYDSNPPFSGGVPYNFSFYVSSVNHSAIYGSSAYTSSIGVTGYASGSDGHGVNAIYSGDTTSCPGTATDCASAIHTDTTGDSYGVFTHVITRTGVFIRSSALGYWDLFDSNTNGNATKGGIYTTGPLSVVGYATFSGGKSGYVVDIAKNGGSQPLHRGDVVVIIGSEVPVVGDIPVAVVSLGNTRNATNILGVVDVLYALCDKPQDSLQAGEKCGGFDPNVTTIQPGQYLSVVTLGAYGYLKVDATNGPIQAGDLLASTDTGEATKAEQITVNGVSFYAPGTILGKALGSLESGIGYIPVFISAH